MDAFARARLEQKMDGNFALATETTDVTRGVLQSSLCKPGITIREEKPIVLCCREKPAGDRKERDKTFCNSTRVERGEYIAGD